MEKKSIKAKNVSLLAQIIAALWIALWTAFKFIGLCKNGNCNAISESDIMLSAFSIAGCFCPVYLSIALDKIRGKQDGQ